MGVCMDARNELKGKRGLVRLLNATRYSLAGYKAAWQDEEAFRQICLLAVIGLPLACRLGRLFVRSSVGLMSSRCRTADEASMY